MPEIITNLLYKIFTKEDGNFALEEFTEILQNRQKRKFHANFHDSTQFSQFKHCFKQALRENRSLLY